MADSALPAPETLRQARLDDPKARDRDLANKFGVTEAQLTAAFTAQTGDLRVTRIHAAPSRVLAAAESLGEVMALTRNESCVHERVGSYSAYHEGPHAGIVLGEEIDLRIFPSHWVHGFAVEKLGDDGPRRSLQVFDAAGDGIHKIHLRGGSNHALWDDIVAGLRLDDQSDRLEVTARRAPDGVKIDQGRISDLTRAWGEMTDTHQFLGLVKNHGMNRLGAYRVAGAPWVRPLAPSAIDAALTAASAQETGIMIFVGNRGCIQIHSGPVNNLRPMGPWQNVMDPRFNLHLRADHIAEVWAVTKPTDRGAAISVEAFDAAGDLILQIFPIPKEGKDSRPEWAKIVEALPEAKAPEVA